MKKYLAFDCAGLHFLVDVADVIEVFDAQASPEDIGKVLVMGESLQAGVAEAEAYWRGRRAAVLSLGQLLESPGNDSCCFVVCRNPQAELPLYLLQVDAIHALREVDELAMQPLLLNNPQLAMVTNTVYLDAAAQQVAYVLDDIQRFFKEL